MKRTKGPWIVSKHNAREFGGTITAPEGIICSFIRNGNTGACYRGEERAEANAEFIVLAVNNHDALVSALKRLLAGNIYGDPEAWNAAVDEAMAVVRQVEGGAPSAPAPGKVSMLVDAAKDALAYIVELGLEGLEAPVVHKLDAAINAAEGGTRATV